MVMRRRSRWWTGQPGRQEWGRRSRDTRLTLAVNSGGSVASGVGETVGVAAGGEVAGADVTDGSGLLDDASGAVPPHATGVSASSDRVSARFIQPRYDTFGQVSLYDARVGPVRAGGPLRTR